MVVWDELLAQRAVLPRAVSGSTGPSLLLVFAGPDSSSLLMCSDEAIVEPKGYIGTGFRFERMVLERCPEIICCNWRMLRTGGDRRACKLSAGLPLRGCTLPVQ